MVHIEPATRLRTDYNRIAELAKKTGDAIYITRSGELDLVVMSPKAFEQRDILMRLGTIVLDSERRRFIEDTGYNLDEVQSLLEREGYCD